jgi:hypothetical protein
MAWDFVKHRNNFTLLTLPYFTLLYFILTKYGGHDNNQGTPGGREQAWERVIRSYGEEEKCDEYSKKYGRQEGRRHRRST